MKIQKPNKVTYSSILKTIVYGIIMIGLIITIVLLGIFIIFPTKNIEGATGRGLPNLEYTGNFSLSNIGQSKKKHVFPGELQLEKKDRSSKEKDKSLENKDRSSKENDKSLENKGKSLEKNNKSLEKNDKSPETFNEIILSIMAPIGTIIKFPDKTNKQKNK